MRLPSIFSRSKPEQKASAVGGYVVQQGLPEPAWMGQNYRAYAHEAYQRNIIAFQAIDRVGRAVASVKWTFWRGEQEILDSPFQALLNRPNPVMTQAQYLQTLIGYWLISGNRYQERVVIGSEPKELYPLRPDRMKVIPSDDGLPAGYMFDLNGRKHRWDMERPSYECDILHEQTFNPLDDWYGLSPLSAGAFAVDQHNEGMNLSKSMLQNSARPSGALVVQKDGSGNFGSLPDEEYNRLKAQLEEQYQGSGNAGRPMLLEGGLDWKQMGLSPNDMDMLETRYAAARDVSLAFGVPPLLLNIPGDSTYSNYKEARSAFWEDTIIPLSKQVAEGWTRWLGPSFGGIEVRPDFDDVPAIAEKRGEMWDMADKSTDLTLNERRELKGFKPVKGGDTILVNANQISLADATAPIDPQEEAPMTAEEAKALAYGLGPHIKAVK